jgi:hypothetical protein
MRDGSPPMFAVDCVCGVRARGERQLKGQIIVCSGCGRSLFIYPNSTAPFETAGGSSMVGHRRGDWPERLRFWLGPAVAGLVTLAVVGAVLIGIVRAYRPADTSRSFPTPDRAERWFAERFEVIRAALADGSYRTALREIDAVTKLRSQFPLRAELDYSPKLLRWRPQIALLADLLPETVNEIVRHSVGLADREWDTIFRERYAGRSLLLDAHVFRDATGHFRIDYELEAAGAHGVWEFDQFRLFERLPLAQPQRLLFGFRLQSVRRTARDRWMVTPEPDSGVLLTDPLLLAGLSLPTDDDLADVLKRQAGWDIDD